MGAYIVHPIWIALAGPEDIDAIEYIIVDHSQISHGLPDIARCVALPTSLDQGNVERHRDVGELRARKGSKNSGSFEKLGSKDIGGPREALCGVIRRGWGLLLSLVLVFGYVDRQKPSLRGGRGWESTHGQGERSAHQEGDDDTNIFHDEG